MSCVHSEGIYRDPRKFTRKQMHYLLTLLNVLIYFIFTLKYTIISLLHVSIFNDHQKALSVPD